jgi:probable phosphoglycerate mutase
MVVLFRHGQCDHNIENRISCGLDSKSELTDFGKQVIRESATELKEYFGDKIFNVKFKMFSSPLLRTKQTSQIICDVLGIDSNLVKLDERLKEAQYGSYNEGPVSNLPYDVYDMDKFVGQGSESYADIDYRLVEFMKNTLNDEDVFIIVSHALPIREMHKMLTGIQDKIKVGKFFVIE